MDPSAPPLAIPFHGSGECVSESGSFPADTASKVVVVVAVSTAAAVRRRSARAAAVTAALTAA
eukprot:scaffold8374_cov175-Amphora_coffeaeformis.AAC.79